MLLLPLHRSASISLHLALACVELVGAIDKHDDCCGAKHARHYNTCNPIDCRVLSLRPAQI